MKDEQLLKAKNLLGKQVKFDNGRSPVGFFVAKSISYSAEIGESGNETITYVFLKSGDKQKAYSVENCERHDLE